MNKLYSRPDIYDITYSKQFEELLQKHYERVFSGKTIKSIHDCSFGTGNLSLILSKMGYKLSGSDISKSMIDKGREKIALENLNIDLIESDFRCLTKNIYSVFDCVISTGNSLAHVDNDGVKKTLSEMSKLIKNKGYIYIDTRNWDRILSKHQRFYYYKPIYKDDTRINFMQVWDYNYDNTITFNLIYSFEKDNLIIKREEFEETYYPLGVNLIKEELKNLGFKNIEIYNFLNHEITEFKDMEWYSIIAQKES